MPPPATRYSPPDTAARARDTGLDPARLPRHVAIIMDGNGRWAKERKLPRAAGHRAGVEAIKKVVKAASGLGIETLTLYAFSTENWLRPKTEVDELMRLMAWALKAEVLELGRSNVRLRIIGRPQELPAPVRKELAASCKALEDNTGLLLNLALNYGARCEIVDAVNRLLERRKSVGQAPGPVTEDELARNLDTAGLPDPDLVIRTSGEMRLSNFLLWQIAYAELYVTPRYWPDFNEDSLIEALRDYQKRTRRFGGV